MMKKTRNKRDLKRKRQITFDLKIENLKQYYPRPEGSKNRQFYTHAYEDIYVFMKKNGFKHRLRSVYVSEEKITRADVHKLIYLMVKEMPWLHKCVKGMDLTIIEKNEYDLLGIIKAAAALQFGQEQNISVDETLENILEDYPESAISFVEKPKLDNIIDEAKARTIQSTEISAKTKDPER